MSTRRWRTSRLRRGLVALALLGLLGAGGLLAGVPAGDPATGNRTMLGFLAGDADEVTAHRSWWRLDWPPGGRDEAATSQQALRVPGAAAGDAVTPDLGPLAEAAPPVGDRASDDDAPAGARGRTGPEADDPGPPAAARPAMRSPEGFDVAAGTAESGRGELVSYTVELEPAVGQDLLAVTAAVEEALHDPRSWVRDHRLRRVEDPEQADVRVVLATPDTVDRLCGEVGLYTEGLYSCWNGTFAALNAMRWERGADDFSDLTTYRRYLVNHEFGHGLGHGHVDCPAPGAPAPVMMQQTISTGACDANGWPYPDASPG
jgi:hypothetical protein